MNTCEHSCLSYSNKPMPFTRNTSINRLGKIVVPLILLALGGAGLFVMNQPGPEKPQKIVDNFQEVAQAPFLKIASTKHGGRLASP